MKALTTTLALAAFVAGPALANPVLLSHEAARACAGESDTSVAYIQSFKAKGNNEVRLKFKKGKSKTASKADYREAKKAYLACMERRLADHAIKVSSN